LLHGFGAQLQPGPGGQLQTSCGPGEHEHGGGSRQVQQQRDCRTEDLVGVALEGEHTGEVQNTSSLGRGIHGRF
jgi:hypothetical protein